MKTLITTIVLGLGLATSAQAHSSKTARYTAYQFPQTGDVIHVSCYRGPWKEVIWDRPNAVFLDSLRAIGYDYATAEAIAERICRDPALVGNREGLRSEMLRIYYDSASFRTHGGNRQYN